MNATETELMRLDRAFWNGDESFFQAHVDACCLVAFPGMSGLMDNKDVAATAGAGDRWRDVETRDVAFVHPTGDTAILTYKAKARRAGGELYKAIVSSGYVKRQNGWKLMFHAHTPIDDANQQVSPD